MRVRSNGSNTNSTFRPTSTASTSYLLPFKPTVAVLVTVRHSDHRNASRNCATDGSRGLITDQRSSGLCPVSECWRR